VIINPFVISRSALGVRCAGGRNWTQGDASSGAFRSAVRWSRWPSSWSASSIFSAV